MTVLKLSGYETEPERKPGFGRKLPCIAIAALVLGGLVYAGCYFLGPKNAQLSMNSYPSSYADRYIASASNEAR